MLWSRDDVYDGAAERATEAEVLAIFERVRSGAG